MIMEKTQKETATGLHDSWKHTFVVKQFGKPELYTAEVVKFDEGSYEVMINNGGLCNFKTLEEGQACVLGIVKGIEHGKSLAKSEIQKLYENMV